ncbi:MAG: hypothetical protein ABW173_04645 [Sphingomonas sp.]
MPRPLHACLAAALAGLAIPVAAAPARETLVVRNKWGAFRDADPPRCFAIAEPARAGARAASRMFAPYASIAFWPTRGVRGQLHVRLRRPKLVNAPIMLAIGEQRFRLIGGGADAWAPDWRVDRAIVAAMRGGTSMSVETRGRDGRGFAEVYPLRGAATAIDAAALGCR